jgi:hypothetical protein
VIPSEKPSFYRSKNTGVKTSLCETSKKSTVLSTTKRLRFGDVSLRLRFGDGEKIESEHLVTCPYSSTRKDQPGPDRTPCSVCAWWRKQACAWPGSVPGRRPGAVGIRPSPNGSDGSELAAQSNVSVCGSSQRPHVLCLALSQHHRRGKERHEEIGIRERGGVGCLGRQERRVEDRSSLGLSSVL